MSRIECSLSLRLRPVTMPLSLRVDAMKRRSRAGGEAIKERRRKTPEPKRRNAPKSPGGSNSSPSGRETEVARLTRDLRDALEQQVATSEVLQVISGSAGDLQPVFAAMLENAVRICDATFGIIYRWDGEFLHALASHKTPTAACRGSQAQPYSSQAGHGAHSYYKICRPHSRSCRARGLH